jgi:hypothetical protein
MSSITYCRLHTFLLHFRRILFKVILKNISKIIFYRNFILKLIYLADISICLRSKIQIYLVLYYRFNNPYHLFHYMWHMNDDIVCNPYLIHHRKISLYTHIDYFTALFKQYQDHKINICLFRCRNN